MVWGSVLIILCGLFPRIPCYRVRLPTQYTAMEDDLSAEFYLPHGPATKNDGAMIHLHYLPGDSFLDALKRSDSTVLLSSLVVPLESQAGNVIFPCGTITHAGPHRVYLTTLKNSTFFGGRLRRVTVAKSNVLYVSWPQMSIAAPEKLETYSVDADLRISFTRNLCSTLLRNEGLIRSSNLIFTPRLEIVECSKSLIEPYSQDCQISSESQIWFSYALPPNFYQRAAMELKVNCSFWGQEGTFRAFLRTDLSHAPIIARSRPILVEQNPVYRLSSNYDSIYPCLENDVKPIMVEKPFCASKADQVQVYGQAYTLSGNNLLIPSSNWRYLGNKRVPKRSEESVLIPCSFFSRDFLRVCFKYVSYSAVGTSNVTSSFCLPIESSANKVEIPTWSGWSEWSSCSVNCKGSFKAPGLRTRHRYCQFPEGTEKKVICEGSPVERESGCENGLSPCFPVIAPTSSVKEYLTKEEDTSPCSCGCIYLVHREQRKILIGSTRRCFRINESGKKSLHWKIKADSNYTLSAYASLIDFSCPGAWFNFRQGRGLDDEIINQMKIPKHNNTVNSNTNYITVELTSIPIIHSSDEDEEEACRFLLVLDIRKIDGIASKRVQTTSGSVGQVFTFVLHHLSVAGVVFLSIVSVSLACLFCVICQFERRRKMYAEWKSRPSSSCGSYFAEDDEHIRQWDTSQEEIPLLPAEETSDGKNMEIEKRKKKKISWNKLMTAMRAKREEDKRNKMKRRLSLQELTFFTQEKMEAYEPQLHMITPNQIMKAIYQAAAIEDKTQTVKLRLRPPEGTPVELQSTALKRKSRSISDIASLISFNIPNEIESKTEDNKNENLKEDDQLSTASTIRPTRRPGVRSSLSTLNSYSRGYRRKNRMSDLSSASSVISSRHSLDLEYDLYDCDIENVAAYPGSNFVTKNFWIYDECEEEENFNEELRMVELFPRENIEEDSKTLVREDVMIESRTSDLTSSIISNSEVAKPKDAMNISGYHSGDEEDLDDPNKLLNPNKKNLMNITHIDSLSFVDEESIEGTLV